MKFSDATTHSDSPDYTFPPFSRSKPPPSPTPLHFHHRRRRRRRRKSPSSASASVRGRRTGFPTTPLRGWKFGDRRCNEEVGVAVSARKLAARIWQLTTEFDGQCDAFDRLKPGGGKMFFPSYHHRSKNCGVKIKSWLQSPLSDHRQKHGALVKHKSSLPFPKFPIEGATRLDPRYTNISTYAVVPVPSFLQAKLERARVRIKELKAEHRSCKNEALQFLRKLGEERTCWMRREHQKLLSIVDDLKHELKRERQSCHNMEVANSKLVNELADAKLTAKKIMQDYEKERKAREFMEEVCHDLAKKIEEDKMKLEEVKRESTKICESVDQERKMLQMAEAWREERVQIKLVDARLILEEKYRQMNNLVADLEVFLRSKDESFDMIEISEAEVIRQAVKSVDIKGIKEFRYMPPKSDNLCSTINDLHNEARTIESGHSVNDSCTSHGCELKNNPVHKPSSGYVDHDGVSEDTIGLEIVSHVEDQGSSYTPDGSNCTVVRGSKEGNILTALGASSVGSSCLTGHESLKSEISEMCDVLAKKLNKKPLPSSRQPRSSDNDGNASKLISVEGSRRFANGSNSKMAKKAPVGALVEGGVCRSLLGRWSSHDLGNPHITRGIRGRIEWPQGIPKNALKAKLLNASYKVKRSENLVV